MPTRESLQQLEALLGRPGAAERATLDHGQCAALVALARRSAPRGRLRQDSWADGATTLTLGADSRVVIGLDFPSGEPFGPDTAWVRCERPVGAAYWRLNKREASRIWLLLNAHERSARPFDAAATVR